MARAGIYKSEVVKARNNLLAMGRYPSIDAIRSELGDTGSKGTIHRYLKEIEEEEGGSTGTQVAVSDAIQDLSARLAERLHQEADQRVTALTDKHKAEIAALNDAMTVLRSEVESFRGQAERQALDLSAEKTAHANTVAALQEERIARAQMAQRIQDMEGQLATEETHRLSLEEKHLHAREALEHFRSAAKEQREQDQRQSEQQIQFLQSELHTAKDTVNTKQQELIRSHEDNARLSSELAHARSELHRQQGEVRSLRSAKENLAVAEVKNQQLSEQLAQANARVADLDKENQANVGKLRETMATGQRLESELMAAKAVVVSHEKIFEKLTALQAPPAKSVNTKKNVDSQNSLFNSEE
ncbi:MAG: DNA-binding protein [Gammaproteobacteria bacterium]|nr:DNA-binding protein [Gammaproteobacteria bacterium]MBU2435559.1 DNA-binding protein [Gammaproteobacteria bacterium]MBU2449661.1 DNA-binding protein [Gammaproteobacteria bacterium]